VDPIVLAAMARWPNVPSVYNWLGLDLRGNYAIKGERIANPVIQEFIARNYACDDIGRWFFQNGPQRVFVKLTYTPFVLRSDPTAAYGLVTHTGQPVDAPHTAFLDDMSALLIAFGNTVGAIHDLDLAEVIGWFRDASGRMLDDRGMEALLAGEYGAQAPLCEVGPARIPLARIARAQVAAHFRFDPDPQPAPGEPEC
jgi:hypothetical protein